LSLEAAKAAFLEGYRIAREGESGTGAGLLQALTRLDPHRRPFALEGAAMAWRLREGAEVRPLSSELLDRTPMSLRPFVLIGIGCGVARLGLDPPEDPTALDGYGFHQGLTSGLSGGETTPGAAKRVDRGRGRALWFVTGGDARAVRGAVEGARNADELWRGIGTACTFAGDPRGHAPLLLRLAERFAPQVAAGSADALELWRSLGDPPARAADVAAILTRS